MQFSQDQQAEISSFQEAFQEIHGIIGDLLPYTEQPTVQSAEAARLEELTGLQDEEMASLIVQLASRVQHHLKMPQEESK